MMRYGDIIAERRPGNLSARSIQFTKLAAAAAAHTRAEGWNGGVIGQSFHIDRTLMAALLAGHEQAPAVLAHATERNGTDWFVVLAVPAS